MKRNILYSDGTNFGKYPSYIQTPDKFLVNSYVYKRVVEHINKLSDVLYLPLSAGIRTPAIKSANIIYDTTSNTWEYTTTVTDSVYIHSITVDTSGGYLNSIDITHSPELFEYSDQTPLVLVSNNDVDVSSAYFYSIVENIYVDTSYLVSRVAVMSSHDSTFTKFPVVSGLVGADGMQIYLESLYQSNIDYNDRLFYTSGVPYLSGEHVYSNVGTLRVTGASYTDYATDITGVPWPCKLQIRAQVWTGDCSTGSGTSQFFYSDWDTSFISYGHDLSILGLATNTVHKLWYRVDARIGADNLEWTAIGCYTVKGDGDPGDDYILMG